jgi:hypothetical protein
MSNTGGGCIIFGVEEKEGRVLEAVGVSSFLDKADVTNGIKSYIPNNLLNMVDIVDFSFDESEYDKIKGKKFQVMFIEYDPKHIPLVSLRDGVGIRASAIYIRREGITEEVNHDELQRVLSTRIETRYSSTKEITLKEHLNQLRVLHQEIPRYTSITDFFSAFADRLGQPNPGYPDETMEEFVLRMIALKKLRIEEELGINHLRTLSQALQKAPKSTRSAKP